MSDITTAALSRGNGLLKELTVIANNIANAGTVGYKREASVFTEFVEGRPQTASVSFGSLRGHYTDLGNGALKKTGGTFDVALEGPGFFAVQRGEETLLTRAGSFQLDAGGQLITPDGLPVLDDAGGTILIPEDAGAITISADGILAVDGEELSRLGVFDAPSDTLERQGAALFRMTGNFTFVDNPSIRQGYVENANVNPVLEMARLIEAQRMFEAGQSVIEEDNDRTQRMIEAMGRRA